MVSILSNIGTILIIILKSFKRQYFSRFVRNYYRTNYSQNVLISYLTHPFRKGTHLSHTNTSESLTIARVLRDLNFNVDIVDYYNEYPIDYSRYDIIFGFGEPLINSFYRRKRKILTIYYGTGMHVCHQNHATLKRIKEVYSKKGQWILESGRIVDKAWSVQTSLVDSIIVLGNKIAQQSYKKYFQKTVHIVQASFYSIHDPFDIINEREYKSAQKHFLCFSGSGFIHKGIDLLLETFNLLPKLHLHICGPIEKEEKFKSVYYKELYELPNIHTYGFINIKSKLFTELLIKCAFTIFPSCSEGGSASVINVMGNGGLIPIVSREATIEIKDFGILIDEISNEGVKEAILKAKFLSEQEVAERSIKCAKDTIVEHSIERFSTSIYKTLKKIINDQYGV